MRFRPCIDIHNGKVKQIVGGSLKDAGGESLARENFVSSRDGAYFGGLYRDLGLEGGHIILLNRAGTPEYEADLAQAKLALAAFPGGMQIGGGVNLENAAQMLAAGASHVIVTSWLFEGKRLSRERLAKLSETVGKERLVIDVSCRRQGEDYTVVTDRWQTFTEEKVTEELLYELGGFCDEFLVHGVDREGTGSGMEEDLVRLLAGYAKKTGKSITYAGGIGRLADLETFAKVSEEALDLTIGSALDLFGGHIAFEDVLAMCGQIPPSAG